MDLAHKESGRAHEIVDLARKELDGAHELVDIAHKGSGGAHEIVDVAHKELNGVYTGSPTIIVTLHDFDELLKSIDTARLRSKLK